MLSEKETHEIEKELKQYKTRQAAGVEALKIIQRSRGWVDDEGIKDLSAILGMTPDELDGVATFYNLIFRKPVGAHVILICDTVSCWVMGYEKILSHLKNRLGIGLGETSPDGLFTLLPIPCLGACDKAPAMMIDEELYWNLTPEKIDELIKRYGWKG
ncbi:MAG: NADH-quinone oxidoreductase subunit NuoE [Deltaproteobacteria bacterium]|nr:NADH-quinone oxidoreductase subunit NuoE [Deltaproteobacteria bacterium]